MAPQINPRSLAKSPTLQEAVVGELARYCAMALGTEAPIVSPNPGYKMYDKRMRLCNVAVKTLNNMQKI